jgi:acetylornithine deacetylase
VKHEVFWQKILTFHVSRFTFYVSLLEDEVQAVEQHVLDAIDVDGMLAYLGELIAVRSLVGQETSAQEHVAARMAQCGLAVDMWELDFVALSRHPAFCVEVDRPHGLGVVGNLGENVGGQSLILNGHVDVVPAGDEANWHYAPWQGTIADGRVYGRGSVDMKGGLCCAIFAAKAIHDAGVHLKGKLMIESVIGEEDGGVGTLAAVLRGYRADGAVIMEPTELAVAPAQAGALNFRITVPGQAAHGCVREEGVSAIEKFFPIYQALMTLESEVNQERDSLFARYQLPYPLCIGTVKGGTWASSVAESLIFEGRYGVPVGADIATERRRFEAALMQAAQADPWLREHPPHLEWWGGQFEPAHIPTDHPIVQTVSEAFGEISGQAAQVEGMTYGADMRLLVNVGGTPTVLFGPGDVRHAHRPDEFVPIEDLLTTVRTLALTALRFCGYEDGS